MTNGWRQFGFNLKRNGLDLLWSFIYDPITARVVSFYRHPRLWRLRLMVTSIVFTAIFIFSIIVVPQIASADAGKKVLLAVGYAIAALAGLFGLILTFLGWVFNGVVFAWPVFQQITTYPAVNGGWEAVRDVANLSFVLILLGIGFATILRVPTYHVKRLIVPFVIALLLINFSKLICGVVLDFCRVLMSSFAQSMSADMNYSQVIAESTGVGTWLKNPEEGTKERALELFQGAVASLIFIVALSFAFLMLIVLLVSRWVSLMVLTIFSPLAYAGMILPSTKGMVSKWWSSFLQKAFYGPAAVFMVWLAIYVLTSIANYSDQFKDPATEKIGSLSMSNLLSLLIAIIILLKAVTISKSMGIAGADAVMKAGKSAGKASAKGLGRGIKNVGKGAAGMAGVRNVGARMKGLRSKLWRGQRDAEDASKAKNEKAASGSMAGRDLQEQKNIMNGKGKGARGGASAAERVEAATQLAKDGKLSEAEMKKAKKVVDNYGSRQKKSEFKDAMKANNIGTAESDPGKAGAYIAKKGVETQSNESLESARTAKLTLKNASRGQVDKLNKSQKKSYAKGLKSALDDGSLTGNDKVKAQREYARMSGGFEGVAEKDQKVALSGMKAKDIAGLDSRKVDSNALTERVQGNLSDLETISIENPEMGRDQRDKALKRASGIEGVLAKEAKAAKEAKEPSGILTAAGTPAPPAPPAPPSSSSVSAEDKKFLESSRRAFGSPVT